MTKEEFLDWLRARSNRTGLEGQIIELILEDGCPSWESARDPASVATHMMRYHFPKEVRYKFYKIIQDWATERDAEEALKQ